MKPKGAPDPETSSAAPITVTSAPREKAIVIFGVCARVGTAPVSRLTVRSLASVGRHIQAAGQDAKLGRALRRFWAPRDLGS